MRAGQSQPNPLAIGHGETIADADRLAVVIFYPFCHATWRISITA
jgi:hypothetical protein